MKQWLLRTICWTSLTVFVSVTLLWIISYRQPIEWVLFDGNAQVQDWGGRVYFWDDPGDATFLALQVHRGNFHLKRVVACSRNSIRNVARFESDLLFYSHANISGGNWSGFGLKSLLPELLGFSMAEFRHVDTQPYQGVLSVREIFLKGVLLVGILSIIPLAFALWWIVGKLRHAGIACPSCGYDLTGNESGVCPECGGKVAVVRRDTSRYEGRLS